MTDKPEVNEIEPEEIVGVPALVGDSDVAAQVTTAKTYPRSVSKFRKEAHDLACLDQDTAGECMYAVPRSGKSIEGPSARFAEIILYAWGNSRAEAKVIDEGPIYVTAEGTFYDVERNVAVRKTVKRRITNKRRERYSDDLIVMTGNAASSIALRNAIFAGIPKALWKNIYEEARLASIGKAGTLTQTRQKMLEHFSKMGITPEQLFGLLDIDGLEDIKEDQLITLRGTANALKEGTVTVEELFNPRDDNETPDLNERLKKEAEEEKKVRAEDAKAAKKK